MGKDAPFHVGTLRLSFSVHSAHSLKEKRQVVNSLKDSIHNKFPVGVAELGELDTWQVIDLGIVACGNDRRHVNAVLSKIVDFARGFPLASMANVEMEFF